MNVREKLVDLICRFCSGLAVSDITPPYGYENLADFMISNGVTVQEWKPISEPPKEKGTYLVCTDNGGVLLGHWYGTAWNAGGGAKKHLAYWMEKPKPPKGE